MLPHPHEKTNTKNLLIAVALSAMILLGFEYYMLKNAPAVIVDPDLATVEVMTPTTDNVAVENISSVQPQEPAKNKFIPFVTENMRGEVSLRGGVPSKVSLVNYQAHGDDSTENGTIDLVNGAPYTQQLGSFYEAGGLNVPTTDTIWTLEQTGGMTVEAPMVLSFKNASGQTFSRELHIDGYTLHVQDTVVNGADVPVSMQKNTTVSRLNGQKPGEMSSWYNFFGPQGLIKGDIVTHSFKKLDKDSISVTGEGGYWGFTEQYFTVMALAPESINTQRTFTARDGNYQAELERAPEFVPAGGGTNFDASFYIGPKRVETLTDAGNLLPTLVDYGWFDFMAKPMFWLMSYFHDNWLGNWGWSIVALTAVLKLLTYPLAAKSYKSMGKMRKIQPEVKALQEKHADGDRQAMATEMMALYKKHGVNPMSGCWPMFIQIPIFFAMYKMVLLTFELRGADFALWINDLSVADPFFVLPVLMGISMWVQMRLSPTMGDPMQAKIMQFMPIVFTVLFLFFPSGLVLYWLTNNVISVAQQYYFMRDAEKA